MKPKMVQLKAGDIIHSPFKQQGSVYLVTKGYIMAFTYDESGRRHIHLIYGPGDYFPVLTVFFEREQRATYESLTDIILDVYTKQDFLSKIDTSHEFSKDIIKRSVNQLGIFANRVVELQASRLEERLLIRLTSLSKEHGIKTSDGVQLPYRLKHHHLADMLGAERESVSRALARLKSKGLLTLSSEGIITLER